MYYKGSKSIIICFDVTDENTFINVKNWLNEIEKNIHNIFIVLVGNKCDLNNVRKVSFENAQLFAKENNLFYIETSAKNNINIIELFNIIADKILEYNNKNNENDGNIDINNNSNYNFNCGCLLL